jgi:NADH-quinone oxidoreductase subunit H
MKALLSYLIFPGFCFTAVMAMLVHWFDRKLTARLQWRVGPPLLQPAYDLLKLLGKETMVPKGSQAAIFLAAPLLGLAAAVLVSTMVWRAMLWPAQGFLGDLIVLVYVLMLPAISVILGGFASRNPIASLGASREMKLLLADELPFLLAILVPVVHAGGSIRLGEVLEHQQAAGMTAGSVSGALALVVVLLAVQAKLTFVPFDIPEAETEIMGGPYVEYSGPPLAVFKLTRMMMHFILPSVVVLLFLGGVHFEGISIAWSILKILAVLLVITLVRNTNPRVRIDQAVKFFWGPMTAGAVAALALAFWGL